MRESFETDFSQSKFDLLLLLLRIVIASFMLTHGLPKFYELMAGNLDFTDPLGIGEPTTLVVAVLAEVVCSTFILIGLGTRIATIPLIATMLVAAFVSNWNNPFEKKELSLLYLFIYVTLLVVGSGRYSLDAVLSTRIAKKKSTNGGS
jgi:putative oxidoreductase